MHLIGNIQQNVDFLLLHIASHNCKIDIFAVNEFKNSTGNDVSYDKGRGRMAKTKRLNHFRQGPRCNRRKRGEADNTSSHRGGLTRIGHD